MNKKPRQAQPEALGEILGKVLKKRNIPHTAVDRQLVKLWSSAVGPRIAGQTHPDRLKRGALYVRVSAPVWMHQLQFLKEEILAKLQSLAGPEAIRSLFFTIGEIPSSPSAAALSTAADSGALPLAGRDRRLVRESIAGLSDPELREILERVMVKEITRRRLREKRPGPEK